MPTVSFTGNIQRHVVCPAENVRATSVRDALEAVFAQNQQARSYFLDEQGALRHHIVVFVNGTVVRDRVHLADTVADEDEIQVFQALSGG